MRKLLLLLTASLFIGLPSASAATILIGVFPGNDSPADVQTIVNNYETIDPSVTLYAKTDDNTSSLMSVTGLGSSSGSWKPVDPSVQIAYFVVKATNNFAVYKVVPPLADPELWTTFALRPTNPPEVSHLSFYLSSIPPNEPAVPEPSTVALIGGAGVGLLAWRRRRTA